MFRGKKKTKRLCQGLTFFKKEGFFWLVLLLTSGLFLRTLVKQGVPYTHDANNHLARIGNLYLALRDGHWPPRWAPHLNYKFGYPVFNFNYYFPFLLTIPFKMVGFSIEAGWKLTVFFSFWLGGLGMYFLLKKFFKRWPALVGAVFYLLAPYQLVNIFVRGMTGEIVAFGLFPWLFLNLVWFLESRSKLSLVSSSLVLAGFFLTHNIIVLISLPVLVLFVLLFNWLVEKRVDWRSWLAGWLPLLAAGLLVLFFWLPALMEKQFTNLDYIDMSHFYSQHFPVFKQLVSDCWGYGFSVPGPEDGMSLSIGPLHFGLVVVASLVLVGRLLESRFSKRKAGQVRELGLAGFFVLVFWLAVFFMLDLSSFAWEMVPFFNYVQFPWRLLFLTTAAGAVAIGFLVDQLFLLAWFKRDQGISLRAGLVIGLLIVGPVVLNWSKAKPQSLFHYPDYIYYEFLFTSSTKDENMPIWFDKEKNYRLIDEPIDKYFSLPPEAEFKELAWQTDKHLYQVETPVEVDIVEHTAYFPGWQVWVDGQRKAIDYQREDYPGLISFHLEPGRYRIETIFAEATWPRKLGDSLSLLGLAGLLTYSLKGKKKKEKEEKKRKKRRKI